MEGKLKVVSFNARSIRNKIWSVMCYLTDHKIHLAFVQETWLRKSDGHLITEIKEYGYNVIQYRKPRKLDLGGGVMLIYKDNINIKNTKTVHYKSFEHMQCKVNTEQGSINFINIYRPEYSSKNRFTVKKFLSEFSSLISDITEEPSTYFLLGDFNLHVELAQNLSLTNDLTVSQNQDLRDAVSFMKLLDEANFKQFVNIPTHEQNGTLDLLIAQSANTDMIKSLKIGDKDEICDSDHYLISFSLDVSPIVHENYIDISKRDFKKYDKDFFCSELQKANLPAIFHEISLDNCVLLYNNTLTSILDKQCPITNMRIKKRVRQKWYNGDLRDIKRKKRSIERKWKKYHTCRWKSELDHIKLQYKKAIFDAKSTFHTSNFDKVKSNSKALHKYVNYVTGNQKSQILPSCSNQLELANKMSNYFDEKIKKIRLEMPEIPIKTDTPVFSEVRQTECTLSHFKELDLDTLKKIITNLNSKGHPHDPAPVWMIKDCIDVVLPIVLYIVNRSLKESVFPQPLKHAVVRPIIKDTDGDSESYKNYRPVSNLPFLSKVIEKCVSLQLNEYLCNNDLYPKCQSAYRNLHSCETALLKIVHDIQTEIYNKNMVALIALDLSSAFDTIDHNLLIEKLNTDFGFSGNIIGWFKSYLNNRTFAVRIGNVDGKAVILIFGVPQGSILGPLLFILYVHDLAEVIKRFGLQAHFYADDSELYVGFSPLSQVSTTLMTIKNCLYEVKNWMQTNFLKLNLDKTQVTFFGRALDFNLFDINLTLEDVTYLSDQNTSIKTLGIHLDSKLTMQKMTSECVKSCYFNLKKLQSMRHFIDKDIKLALVNSHILSRLDYCNILFSSTNKSQITKLQRVLNASVRFIFNLKKSQSVSAYTQEVHFLPVSFRIMYKSCVTVYKILYDMAPEYLSDMVTFTLPSRPNLRSMNDILKLQLPDQTQGIHYNMINTWNCLPFELRHEPDFNVFKKRLKTFYFQLAYNT